MSPINDSLLHVNKNGEFRTKISTISINTSIKIDLYFYKNYIIKSELSHVLKYIYLPCCIKFNLSEIIYNNIIDVYGLKQFVYRQYISKKCNEERQYIKNRLGEMWL